MLTPEQQLCVLLSRGSLPPEDAGRIRELAARVNWDELLELLISQQVLPLAYRNLAALGFESVPSAAKSRITVVFGANGLRNDGLMAELVRLLRLLSDAGVPVAPLKGPLLAESLYGDASLRMCTDLDLLAPSASAARACQVLVAAGYSGDSPDWFFSRYALRNGMEAQFVRQRANTTFLVELHWGILGWGFLEEEPLEDLWSEAAATTIRGVPAYVLSAEWQLLFLFVHAARHRWKGLLWLVDIDEVCRRGTVDWARVRDKAERFGWSDLLPPALSACRALFQTPVPTALAESAAGPTQGNIFARSEATWDSVRHTLFCLRLLPGRRKKIAYFTRRLLAPTYDDRKFLYLPAALSPIYYVSRPLRLGVALTQWAAKRGWRRASRI